MRRIPYEVGPARPDEIEPLPAIERRAAELFRGMELLEPGVLADETPLESFRAAQRAGLLWVARSAEGPVGFALAEPLAGLLHLDELDVDPDHGRRGLGRRLVEAVCAEAARRGLPAVTLTTFRDVPWNAPFYRGLGFRELASAERSPALAALVEEEARGGLDPSRRVVMRRDVSSSP